MTASSIGQWGAREEPLLSQRMLVNGLFLVSAYDVYFTRLGLPLVPVVGSTIVLSLFWASARIAEERSAFPSTFLTLALLAALTVASSVWAHLYFGMIAPKGPIGVLLGLALAGSVVTAPSAARALYRALNAVVFLHVILWAIQVVWFLGTGKVLDLLQPITGIETRSMYFGFSRFTGFFTEPAALALFMYMGLSARLVYNRFVPHKLDALLLIVIVSSVSASGYFLALGLLAIVVGQSTPRRALAITLSAAGITAAIAMLVARGNPKLVAWVLRRLMDPTADASGAIRLTGILRSFFTQPEVVQLFGIGVGNYTTLPGSVSGYQNLTIALGLVGVTWFLVAASALFAIRRASLTAFALWAMSFLATAMWTIPYWWLWTGMLILFSAETARVRPPGFSGLHQAGSASLAAQAR